MKGKMVKPKIGAMVMAYPGNNLGDDKCGQHMRAVKDRFDKSGYEIVIYSNPILSEQEAMMAGQELNKDDVDMLFVILTTFIPDYFVVKLLDACDKPVFIWSYEWSINSLSIVGGMLVTGTLNNLGKQYTLESGDLYDEDILTKFNSFAYASMLFNRLKQTTVGVSGGKNNIMMSMMWDEFSLKRAFGASIANIAIEELYREADQIPDSKVKELWKSIQSEVGSVNVLQKDGELSSRYYAAAKKIAAKYGLSGYSINCFPELKSKICLGVAKLNDDGIAAGCEGDLNSTFIMMILQSLSGRAGFNGDYLWMYRGDNAVLFSHCGAGAFSLAKCREKVALIQSIESCDGCAVCYPTYAEGEYTLLNMMAGKDGLRVFALKGFAMETDLEYSGTPIKIGFEKDVNRILADCVEEGTGHHWSGAPGNYIDAVRWLCKFANVGFKVLS